MNPNMLQNMGRMAKIAKLVKNGNPQEIAMEMAKNSNNPLMQQLVQFAQEGKQDKIEEFGRNYCKEHGINFDEEINIFQSLLK